MLLQCWPIGCDSGPTINQHLGSVSCLLGYESTAEQNEPPPPVHKLVMILAWRWNDVPLLRAIIPVFRVVRTGNISLLMWAIILRVQTMSICSPFCHHRMHSPSVALMLEQPSSSYPLGTWRCCDVESRWFIVATTSCAHWICMATKFVPPSLLRVA